MSACALIRDVGQRTGLSWLQGCDVRGIPPVTEVESFHFRVQPSLSSRSGAPAVCWWERRPVEEPWREKKISGYATNHRPKNCPFPGGATRPFQNWITPPRRKGIGWGPWSAHPGRNACWSRTLPVSCRRTTTLDCHPAAAPNHRRNQPHKQLLKRDAPIVCLWGPLELKPAGARPPPAAPATRRIWCNGDSKFSHAREHSVQMLMSVSMVRCRRFVWQQELSASTCHKSGKSSHISTYSLLTILLTTFEGTEPRPATGMLTGSIAPDEEIVVNKDNKDVPFETIIGLDQVVDELDTAPVATENVGRDPAAKHGGKTSQYDSSCCPSALSGGWVRAARSRHPSACVRASWCPRSRHPGLHGEPWVPQTRSSACEGHTEKALTKSGWSSSWWRCGQGRTVLTCGYRERGSCQPRGDHLFDDSQLLSWETWVLRLVSRTLSGPLRPHPGQGDKISKKKSKLRHQKVLPATRLLTQNMAEPRARPNCNRIRAPHYSGLANLG